MSALAEFQKTLIDAMRGDATITGLVNAEIHESMPASRPNPCIALGPSDKVTGRMSGKRIGYETVQIDVFYRTGGEKLPVKKIVEAIIDLLDDADLPIADPYSLESLNVELARVFDGPVGTGVRGIVQVTGEVSRPAQ